MRKEKSVIFIIKLKFETNYLNCKRHGKGKEYYNDGKLIFETEYLNGKGIQYNSNDELEFEGEYLNNKRWNGKGKEYNKCGKLGLNVNI